CLVYVSRCENRCTICLQYGLTELHIANLLQEPVYLLSGLNFPVKILGTSVASVAALLPLTTGIDAMRQVLFLPSATSAADHGLLPVGLEVGLLAVLALLFIVLARYLLARLEQR